MRKLLLFLIGLTACGSSVEPPVDTSFRVFVDTQRYDCRVQFWLTPLPDGNRLSDTVTAVAGKSAVLTFTSDRAGEHIADYTVTWAGGTFDDSRLVSVPGSTRIDCS